MANPPRLQVSGLPHITAAEQAATTSPARGAEMLNFLQTRLNQKNRAPPLVHSWEFWHDRQDRSTTEQSGEAKQKDTTYESRLELLAQISDVKAFWSVFNNFDITRLQLRDSIHLFHKGVKPVWEDSRNEKGGSWTFRVPKSNAQDFWKELCMMAIGEQLQSAVQSDQNEKKTFRDDICGVSLSVRFNSMLIQIWNRDAEHQAGVENVKETVLEGLSPELKPREGSYYYKRHNEHVGFGKDPAPVGDETAATGP
ncbi:Eukaryotic translation initiation factor 4E type 3 [Pseudocercospora fuligena]|uniref:Eukaryotic translation initiation factor 4E type 3 n=1 Tax=Pseudocercospora fuligena TaxID=685502 RepID=A0A8H6RGB6_9PEZI|nr:Eukaryotic translation initiation factor 4E type 3 [Pseudocercospora fuligena]